MYLTCWIDPKAESLDAVCEEARLVRAAGVLTANGTCRYTIPASFDDRVALKGEFCAHSLKEELQHSPITQFSHVKRNSVPETLTILCLRARLKGHHRK
jgi:hypothetical protein